MPQQAYNTISRILDPCRITVVLRQEGSELRQSSGSEIEVQVEPLYLKIGFKHIDFANVAAAKLQDTLLYIN